MILAAMASVQAHIHQGISDISHETTTAFYEDIFLLLTPSLEIPKHFP